MKSDLLQFGSLLTWWWLPSFGSQLLINSLYSLHLVTPPPPSAHRLRTNHLQLARAAVVVGTLFYQLFQAASTAAPNYYQLLALPLDVDADGVKRSFRALARKYHPDKVGEQGEALFIVLRRAHDALSDPVRRFAYDRFGPSVVDWKDCESSRDFMRRGLTGLVAFYTINPLLYAAVGYISSSGTRSDGLSFWRLACLFSLLAFELQLLISPEPPTWLTLLLPNTTIADVRQLAHSLFVNFFFASLQLSAALDVLEYGQDGAPARDRNSKALLAERQLAAIQGRAQGLDAAAQAIKARMLQSLALELRPLRTQVEQNKEEAGRQMSADEERMFEKIDTVLLCRSLVQQHPQLASMVGKRGVDEEAAVKEEKEEEPLIRVKEEPLEEVLREPETALKAEESTIATQELVPETESKAEKLKEIPLASSLVDQMGGAVESSTTVEVVKEKALEPVTVEQPEARSHLDIPPPDPAAALPTHVETTEPVAASALDESSTTKEPAIETETETETPGTTAPASNDVIPETNAPAEVAMAAADSSSS
ncbi:hypothetical protein EX895_006397 [Sporisorium graminicola]|uniref:J domain-containing protein n=1 Tax=Sporisorium graminicola TaxID=280036 RepID=A0A4U7KL52_9BASI|nr:hypothetical protein EX895_006397 [Sporisorium graminicola]TKY84496.1 hypothetical protein EX895_006397 [Sporisorium graminicola]